MRLAILGANGGCGQELVDQALDRGHDVHAVLRNPDWEAPEGVPVFRGDQTDPAFLRAAVADRDAVVSALGLHLPGLAPWKKPEDPDFLSDCADALIPVMQEQGVDRLMAISAAGVGDSYDDMPFAFRMILRTTGLGFVYERLAEMEERLLASGLDVCIPRPTQLTDEPATGEVQITEGLGARAAIPRADVAGWMLDQLGHEPFPHDTPLITVTGAR